VWTTASRRAREAERSDRRTLIEEEAREAAERGLNILYEVAWELATSRVVHQFSPSNFQRRSRRSMLH
jgi:hypothetical protein